MRLYNESTETLLAREKRILEMIARNSSLTDVLEELCRLVESNAGGSLCSILLVDPVSNQIQQCVAPSLPQEYNQAMIGRPVDPAEGPCGMAAYLKERVIASDVATDARWDASGWGALAISHGLRSCWSTPILSAEGSALGTFAIYSREPRSPSLQQQKIIDQVTHLAGIAIEQTRAANELQRSKRYLAEAQQLSHTGSFCWVVSTGEITWSDEIYRIYELDPKLKPTFDLVFSRIHPEEAVTFQEIVNSAIRDVKDLDFIHRLQMPDASVKYLHVIAHPFKDESNELAYVGAVRDITAAKRAEEIIRQNEKEFRQIVEAIPQLIIVLSPEGKALYANELLLQYGGLTLVDVQASDFRERFFHPEDVERLQDERRQGLLRGLPFEMEQRALGKNGEYRWFLTQLKPQLDEQGKVIRWYATGTDIHERKQAEERVQKENIALREEIDKTSMFEEIVGSSAGLNEVLSRVGRVAPTDSTVLITGETGTGKELIARAIHKRSQRAGRAFISVNCAAIPQSLIASELFGHEKGAFTGALQRRPGRFELAEGGTIFLDEIGELPMETQVALLRVLQEREFERVGGTQPIRTDVRVIAATNRDLKASIDSGKFRSDLFYRFNVFPIEVPPLRERKEDILMLVKYFIDRYASKMGKKIRTIDKKTLALLQSYPWPGNIRELQNVIERSVIVCESDNFVVDEGWVSGDSVKASPAVAKFSKQLLDHEKEMIEAALDQTKGRVSGPKGAAVRLGIPASTLESKIRSLKIDKYRFKTTR